MNKIDESFLLAGPFWSEDIINNLTFSFLESTPSLFFVNPSFLSRYNLLDGGEELSNSDDSSIIDQKDIIRFLLLQPTELLGLSGIDTINSNLVNTANTLTIGGNVENYRVSFSDLLDINFAEDVAGTIRLINHEGNDTETESLAVFPGTSLSDADANDLNGDIVFNQLDNALSELNPGQAGFWLHLHELGHAILGLADVDNTSEAGSFLDNQKYTMMSYNAYGVIEPSTGQAFDDTRVYATGLQLLDIEAIRTQYPTLLKENIREGDTVYSLGKGLGFSGGSVNDAFLYTILDTGGIDTFDVSQFGSLGFGSEVDLREGRFSSVGVDSAGNPIARDLLAQSTLDPDPGNVAIAYGTEIENAIGTIHADNIYGNDLKNIITGNGGNDELHGGLGDDIFHVGAGQTTLFGEYEGTFGAQNPQGEPVIDFDTLDLQNFPNGVTVSFEANAALGFTGQGGFYLDNNDSANQGEFVGIEHLILSETGQDTYIGDAQVIDGNSVYGRYTLVENADILDLPNSGSALTAQLPVALTLGHTFVDDGLGLGTSINYSQLSNSITYDAVAHTVTDGTNTDTGVFGGVGTDFGDTITLGRGSEFYTGRGDDTITALNGAQGEPLPEFTYTGGNDTVIFDQNGVFGDFSTIINFMPGISASDITFTQTVTGSRVIENVSGAVSSVLPDPNDNFSILSSPIVRTETLIEEVDVVVHIEGHGSITLKQERLSTIELRVPDGVDENGHTVFRDLTPEEQNYFNRFGPDELYNTDDDIYSWSHLDEGLDFRFADGTRALFVENGSFTNLNTINGGAGSIFDPNTPLNLTATPLPGLPPNQGTPYDDVLSGTGLVGGSGNDTLIGGGSGGYGDDHILQATGVFNFGDYGDDVLEGTNATETLNGGFGNDTLRGFGGNDTLNGDVGDDTLYPGLGFNTVDGGAGFDTVIFEGNFAEYRVSFTDGAYYVTRDFQNDFNIVKNVENIQFADTLPDEIVLDDIPENILPTASNSFFEITTELTGNLILDTTLVNPNKQLSVSTVTIDAPDFGTVTINENGDFEYTPFAGFAGNDNFSYAVFDEQGGYVEERAFVNVRPYQFGTEGRDVFIGNPEDYTLNESDFGAGNGLIFVKGDDILTGEGAGDTLIGLGGADELFGGFGNDRLDGGEGNDLLDGGANADVIYAGIGNDEVTTGHGADVIVVLNGSGSITITDFDVTEDVIDLVEQQVFSFNNIFISQTLDGDARIFTGSGQEIVFQNIQPFELSESNFNFATLPPPTNSGLPPLPTTELIGTSGFDFLQPSDPNGTAVYGRGDSDELYSSFDGGDYLFGEDGDDFLFSQTDFGSSPVVLDGGAGFDELYGGFGDDYFIFNANDAGYDILREQEGNDVIVISNELDTFDLSFSQGSFGLLIIENLNAAFAWEGVELPDQFGTGFEGDPTVESIVVQGQIYNLNDVVANGFSGASSEPFGEGGEPGPDPNQLPIARDDLIIGTTGQPVTGNVLDDNGNGPDYDPNGIDISVVPVNQSIGIGTLQIASNGDFTLIPNAGFTNQGAPVSFTYTLTDPQGNTAQADISFEILPFNEAPVLTNNGASVDENGSLVITAAMLSISDPDSTIDELTFTLSSLPQNGVIEINGVAAQIGDAFSARDTIFGGVIYTPAADFAGDDTFNFVLSDGRNILPEDTFAITVVGINDDPVANDDVFDVAFEAAVTGNVLDNDTDADNDALSVVETQVTTAQGVVVDIASTGEFTYTAPTGFSGPDSFTYTVDDGNGGSDTASVTINVEPDVTANQPPVANADTAVTDEDTAIIIDVLANDTDPDTDPLDVTAVTQGANGSVVINGDGTVTYTPDANFFGTDSFSYDVTDGTETVSSTVDVTVNAVNDEPTVNNNGTSLDEDTSITLTATMLEAMDIDNTPAELVFSLNAIPVNSNLQLNGVNLTVSDSFTMQDILDGVVTFTPNADENGSFAFDFTLSDGEAVLASQMFMINVNPVNDNPVAADDSFSSDRDQDIVGNVLTDNGSGVDSDIDLDTLSVVPQSFTTAQGGIVTLLANGDFTYAPESFFVGDDSFDYELTDGQGGSAFGTVLLTLNALAGDDAGTDGDDTISQGNGNGVVLGGAGNDDLDGGNGSDVVSGGSGNDTLNGGNGNDTVLGGSGDDALQGGNGGDTLDGGSGDDTLDGGNGSDTIAGGEGSDIIDGDNGNDTIDGGAGDDVIDAGNGGDTVFGGDGNDTIVGFNGSDIVDGGSGNDTIDLGNGNDVAVGGDGDDFISGGNGSDTLYGGDGLDTLIGGFGSDTFVFEAPSAFNDIDVIQDFANNDALDVADLLFGYDPLVDAITDYVQVTDNGTDSFLSVDSDGGADAFVQIATLQNVTGLTDEADLESNGQLITV